MTEAANSLTNLRRIRKYDVAWKQTFLQIFAHILSKYCAIIVAAKFYVILHITATVQEYYNLDLQQLLFG